MDSNPVITQASTYTELPQTGPADLGQLLLAIGSGIVVYSVVLYLVSRHAMR